MNEKLKTFMSIYDPKLREAVEQHPTEYGYGLSTVTQIVGAISAGLTMGNFSHEGRAFKATCEALGIPHSRKAILDYIAEETPTEAKQNVA